MKHIKTSVLMVLLSSTTLSEASYANTISTSPDCWMELIEEDNGQILTGYASDIQGGHYELTTRTRGAGQVMDSSHTGSVEALGESRLFTIAMTGSVPGQHRGETAPMPGMSRFMRSLENRVARARAVGRPNARIDAEMLILDASGQLVCEANLD